MNMQWLWKNASQTQSCVYMCVCLQPRQSLLNAAARVGDASQDFITCIESESDLDREFKVHCIKPSVVSVYFMLAGWLLMWFKQIGCELVFKVC